MRTRTEFKAKEARLAEVCELMASAAQAQSPKTALALRRMSGAFYSSGSIEEKSEAAGDLRRLRRVLEEGFTVSVPSSAWREVVEEAFDLSTIYSESRYSDVREQKT